MPCQVYSVNDLDDYEEEAEGADAQHQTAALKIIAAILNNARVTYGLMGGMNFYLRGSGRTTQDVDLAVSRSTSLSAVLDLLNNESAYVFSHYHSLPKARLIIRLADADAGLLPKPYSVIRPGSRMLWASGVARIFVRVGSQIVQLDLKSQGAEGHGMPSDLAAATELIAIGRDGATVRFLAVGPLVKAKFQSYGRGFTGDYTDLHFVIRDRTYAAQVRQIADRINYEKRLDFVDEVVRRNREDEEIVRWALKIERSPSPENPGPGGPVSGGRGGGGRGGGASRDTRDSRDSRDSRDNRGSRDSHRDTRESTSRTYGERERRSGTTTTSSLRYPTSSRASDTLASGMQRLRVSDSSRSRPEPRPSSTRVSRQPAPEVRRTRRSDREPEYY